MHKFHEFFLNELRPLVDAASSSDKKFILSCFMNGSPIRLTPVGYQYLKKSKLMAYLSIRISSRQTSPRELLEITRRTNFPFFLDANKFVTFDPKIITHLHLLDRNFDLWMNRKNS